MKSIQMDTLELNGLKNMDREMHRSKYSIGNRILSILHDGKTVQEFYRYVHLLRPQFKGLCQCVGGVVCEPSQRSLVHSFLDSPSFLLFQGTSE